VHVDDEVGQALVLRLLGIGAHDERAEPADVRQRRPDLLAVDDPLVAVPDRARRQAGDVGAGARLREQLAPDLLAGEQRAEVALLLLLAAVRDDRRRRHPVTDRVAVVRDRRTGGGEPLVDRLLQLRGLAETAVALGEVDPRETLVELRAQEGRGVGGLRIEVGEELLDLLDDELLVGVGRGVRVGQSHFGPPGTIGWLAFDAT
jgi:hypothetical protein